MILLKFNQILTFFIKLQLFISIQLFNQGWLGQSEVVRNVFAWKIGYLMLLGLCKSQDQFRAVVLNLFQLTAHFYQKNLETDLEKQFYITNCSQNLFFFHKTVVKVRTKKVWRHTWKDLTSHQCAEAHRLRNTGLEKLFYRILLRVISI